MSEEVSKEQLVGQIRFALQSMGEKNEHHRFEDLCRAFARERIAPNILPATGPVGAGGDQGRDFETFRSHLRDELGPHGAFAKHPRIAEISASPEVEGESLPDLAAITVAELDLARRMGNMMVLKNWDLEPRARFGAVDPYTRFLAERYAYWSDDVPHEDPFPGP